MPRDTRLSLAICAVNDGYITEDDGHVLLDEIERLTRERDEALAHLRAIMREVVADLRDDARSVETRRHPTSGSGTSDRAAATAYRAAAARLESALDASERRA